MTDENTTPPTYAEIQAQISELQTASDAAYLRETGLPKGWEWRASDVSPHSALYDSGTFRVEVSVTGATESEVLLTRSSRTVDVEIPASVAVSVLRKAGLLPAEGPSARDAIVALYRRATRAASGSVFADELCDLLDLDKLEIREEAYSK